jgi:hypothetical protein
MTNKFFNNASFLILGSAFFSVILFAFWQFYPYKVLTFNNSPFPVMEKNIKAGGTLTYTIDYCKEINNGALISKTFSDEISYSVESELNNRPIGCHKINVDIDIPKTLPPDEYNLQLVYRFKLNPIRYVEVSARTEQFNITK